MALFDNNPLYENISSLANPITSGIGGLFKGMTPFGSSIPEGILTSDQEDKLRNQALFQGLLGTAATYLATPKNLNAGSPLPYIGKAFLGGMGASQDVIDRALLAQYRKQLATTQDDGFSKINPLDVTPESLEAYIKGGKKDPSVLRRATIAEKPQGPIIVAPGSTVYDPTSGVAQFTAPDKSKITTDIIDVGGKKILINKETGAPIQEFAVTKHPKEEDTFKQTNELRNTFQNLPEVKSWNITQPILVSAREAAKDTTGASDLNLIYALGKALDPNSVVREGELELAAGTGSLGEKLKGYYKSTAVGGKLTPEVKQDLLRQIESRTYAQKKQYESAKKQYTNIANKYKLDPSELFIEPIVEPLDTSQPLKKLSTQDEQALNWANANPKDPRAALIKQRLGL